MRASYASLLEKIAFGYRTERDFRFDGRIPSRKPDSVMPKA
jgi:hypothetical protein